jgi:hypothetical protein
MSQNEYVAVHHSGVQKIGVHLSSHDSSVGGMKLQYKDGSQSQWFGGLVYLLSDNDITHTFAISEADSMIEVRVWKKSITTAAIQFVTHNGVESSIYGKHGDSDQQIVHKAPRGHQLVGFKGQCLFCHTYDFVPECAPIVLDNGICQLLSKVTDVKTQVEEVERIQTELAKQLNDATEKLTSSRNMFDEVMSHIRLLESRLGEDVGTKSATIRDETTQKLMTALENERQSIKQCAICMNATKNMLFRPCGHVCVCSGCGNRGELTRCPLCQAHIQEKIGGVFI